MGGLREVCGAVSGMFMVMGMLKGYDSPGDPQAKAQHYQRIQTMAAQVSDQYGTLICRDLLAQNQTEAAPVLSEQVAAINQKRQCARYVEMCAALVEEALLQR